MTVKPSDSSGDIQKTVQIALLKQQIDIEKSNVQTLYASIARVSATGDAYIPSGGSSDGLKTYKP